MSQSAKRPTFFLTHLAYIYTCCLKKGVLFKSFKKGVENRNETRRYYSPSRQLRSLAMVCVMELIFSKAPVLNFNLKFLTFEKNERLVNIALSKQI